MSHIYGASKATWLHWDVVLECGPDLLPIVCQPGLTLAPTSALKQYGKVPSRFDAQGRVVGIPKWTQYRATDADIEKWSSDDRLGICLQTRRIRALDVDIEDFDAAQTVREYLDEWSRSKGMVFSYRVRKNSTKFLILFELEGDYAKQVLQTPHGAIELLMGGQQCVVAGSHPSGVHYDWEGGLDVVTIPRFTAALFEEMKRMLVGWGEEGCRWSEGHVRKVRDTSAVTVVDDPIVDYLIEHEWTTSSGGAGRVDLRCPWKEDHSCDSGPTETSYFLAGYGGFEVGHFKCLHASHAGKTDRDFLEAIGFMSDGFEDISEPHDVSSIDSFTGGFSDVPAVAHPCALPPFDRQPKTGKIKPHANNLLLFVNWLCEQGEGVRFDVFRDEILLRANDGGERSFTDADYTRFQVRAEQGATGFAPLAMDLIRRVVHMVAQNRCLDSAQDWLRSIPPWDGVTRVDTFCPTYLGSAASPYTRAVGRYLWTAMPGRILTPGSQADMAVILVSAQGTGKSSSVRAMAPMRDYYIDLSLSDRDADLARLTRGKTLVELSELRGLHTKEMDSIKSFVTRLDSEWVPKYFEMRTVYQRRFIMIGTTNNDEFLGDVTGERRWLPLRVGKQAVEQIQADHAQLWAEGRALYEAEGILWKEAQTLGAAEHAEFSIQDVWVDILDQWLHTEEFGTKPVTREYLHMKDVLREGLGLDPREGLRANQMRVGDAMRRLGYKSMQKWINNRPQKVWVRILPDSSQLKTEVDSEFF